MVFEHSEDDGDHECGQRLDRFGNDEGQDAAQTGDGVQRGVKPDLFAPALPHQVVERRRVAGQQQRLVFDSG